mgnify:CR=1 FL=1|jgi:hypothetical protein
MRDYRNRAEMATQFRAMSGMPKGEDRVGGCIEVVPFYRHTYHKKDLGKGLGVNHTNSFIVKNASVAAGEIDSRALNHAATSQSATIELNPEHRAFGANLCYHQCLSSLYEGLYFGLNTAIAQDGRRDNLAVTGTNAAAVKLLLVKTASQNGRYTETTWENKIGLESPEVCLGYKFFDNDSGNASLNIAGVLATGTDPNIELVNEPVVGGKNFGLGAGLTGCANLMDNENSSFKVFFDANYRYFFKRDVKTIPGLKGLVAAEANGNWGHLYKLNATGNPTVANYYGQDAEVTPGSMFDGYAMLCYCMDNFCLDFGYHAEFRQSHTAKPKTAFVITKHYKAAADAAGTDLAATNLNWKREQMFISRFFVGAGMNMKDWDYPVLFGVGGLVDVANKKQITPENWEVYGKVGICF